MKTFTKHLLLDFGVVFGNILLSIGIFWLANVVHSFFEGIVDNVIQMENMLFLMMGALFTAINILLYKAVFKKHFKPAEDKNPSFYILLPIVLFVIWIAAFFLSLYFRVSFLFAAFVFAALSLAALILLTVAYCKHFKKFIGEAYYVYMISLYGVTIIPGFVVVLAIGLG